MVSEVGGVADGGRGAVEGEGRGGAGDEVREEGEGVRGVVAAFRWGRRPGAVRLFGGKDVTSLRGAVRP